MLVESSSASAWLVVVVNYLGSEADGADHPPHTYMDGVVTACLYTKLLSREFQASWDPLGTLCMLIKGR